MTRPWLWGIGAAAALWLFYAVIMALTMPNWPAARLAFLDIWPFIAVLGAGFGVQIGLWRHLHIRMHETHGNAAAAASGTSSGIAMAACCAHHAADILPFVGLAGVAGTLTRYQQPILLATVAVTFFGVAYMVYLLRKHRDGCP